jgi:hypothetical protein
MFPIQLIPPTKTTKITKITKTTKVEQSTTNTHKSKNLLKNLNEAIVLLSLTSGDWFL